MKITANFNYSNTELMSYTYLLYRHMRKLRWFVAWLGFYLILVMLRVINLFNGSGELTFLGDGFFYAAPLLPLFFIVVPFAALKFFIKNQYSFEVGQQKVVWIYNTNQTHIAWDAIAAFTETKHFIIFYMKEQNMLLLAIPKRAFTTYDELNLCIELFKSRVRP